MRCAIIVLLLAGTLPAMAQAIDRRDRPGCIWIGPDYGYDCPVRKVIPPRGATPEWWRRYYGPPPDWRVPPVRCFRPGDCPYGYG